MEKPMAKELSNLQVEFKEFSVSDDKGSFEGYGAVFGNIDLVDDILLPTAVDDSLKSFSDKGKFPSLFFNHDRTNPVGEIVEMAKDDNGVKIKGVLWVEGNSLGRSPVEQAEVARNVLQSKAVVGLSIGYITKKASWTEIDGKSIRVLENIDMLEISVVHNPANDQAKIISIKSINEINKRELEQAVKACGLSVKQAKIFVSKGMEAVCDEREPEVEEVCEEQLDSNSEDLELILSSIKQNNLIMEIKNG